MTQFVLVRSSIKRSGLKLVEELHDDFLIGMVVKLFPDSPFGEIFVIDDGEDIDSLMLDAQKQVIESVGFEKTQLYGVVENLAPSVDELIFWYGSESDDLEYVYDVPILLGKLKEAVSDSSCELYLHYKRNS